MKLWIDPNIFKKFINKIASDLTSIFLIDYLDDILNLHKTEENHKHDLHMASKRLLDSSLFFSINCSLMPREEEILYYSSLNMEM